MTWDRYLDIVLAATLSGLATIWICSRKCAADLTEQRRLIARYVRDQLNKQGHGMLGHTLGLQIGGKDYDAA